MHYQGIDGYVYNVLENEKIAGGGVSPCQGEGRGFESRLVLAF